MFVFFTLDCSKNKFLLRRSFLIYTVLRNEPAFPVNCFHLYLQVKMNGLLLQTDLHEFRCYPLHALV